jgi:hypothetical protein
MLRATIVHFSRPQRQHFRKKIPGFYAPYLGASFMKHWPIIPYKQLRPSLFHYPRVSKVSGKPIDWRYTEPKSGFEAIDAYGENTIELKGLPMGKTPEYMQERLRRFFSKFGPVTLCRALNHPLDPYQCEGTAFLSFRDWSSCEAASNAIVRFGTRDLGYKTLSLRVLKTDEVHDGKLKYSKKSAVIESLVAIADRIFTLVNECAKEGLSINDISISQADKELIELEFGGLTAFLRRLDSLFFNSTENQIIFPRRLVDARKVLDDFKISLTNELDASLSVHWRINAPIKDLPEYTKRQIRLWDKKDPLPFDLQILSRDMRQYRVFDEKFLVESKRKRERAWNRAENRKIGMSKRKGYADLELMTQ